MICVTGATGLVGAHVLYELISKGNKVRALKRPSSDITLINKVFSYYSKESANLVDQIEWFDADILDRTALYEAFEGIEYVYHTAAFVSFVPSQRKMVLENNITGTANVVNACINKGVNKLCHVSSVAAIGSSANGLIADESMIWSPAKKRSVYSISKFHAEMEVWRGIEEGLNAVIVNPSVIIGPGNWGKSSTALFPLVNNGMKFYTPGSTGYVDVRDVARAMVLIMDSNVNGQRYILNSEEKSFKEIFTAIAIALNKNAPTKQVPRFLAELAWRAEWLRSRVTGSAPKITREIVSSGFNKSAFSSEKIKKEFGFEFISVEKSIADTAALFLNDLK